MVRGRARRFDHIELAFVRGEGKAVWAVDVVVDNRHASGLSIDAIDPLRQFLLRLDALVIADDAEGGSVNQMEPSDLTTRSFGGVEPLAVDRLGEDSDRAVISVRLIPATAVFRRDETPLPVTRVAIGMA